MPDDDPVPMDVGNGAAIPNAVSLTAAITFFGRDAQKTPGSLRINEFLQEVECRRQQHGWSDENTIRFSRACFKGEANDWFGNLQAQLRREDIDIYNDWARFRSAIKEHYGAGGDTKRVNWRRMLTQSANEDAWRFTTRMLNEVTQWTKEHGDSIARSRDRLAGDYTLIPNIVRRRDILEAMAGAADIADATKVALRQRHEEFATDICNRYILIIERMIRNAPDILIDAMARDAFIDGLTSPKVRAEALRLIAEHPDIETMKLHDRIGHFEHQSRAASANEVDAEQPQATTNGEAQVGAVRDGAKHHSGRTPSTDGKTNKHAHLTCRYCKKRGHIIRECRKKKKDEKSAAAATEAAKATSNNSDSNEPAGDAFVNFVQAGNANGM